MTKSQKNIIQSITILVEEILLGFFCFLYKYFLNLNQSNKYSISLIIERYTKEDIAEGYRLTKVPHKRPDYYSQSMNIFLKSYLKYKKIDFTIETSERLEKSCSFKHKSSSLKTKESYLTKRNNNNNNNNTIDILQQQQQDEKKLTQSLNESSIHSVLTSNNTFTSKLNNQSTASNNITSMTSSNKTTIPTSRSITSPLSSILLQTANTLVNSTSFKDLRNYDRINNNNNNNNNNEYDRESKKISCGNFSRNSISIKQMNNLTSKLEDKKCLTGFLNKYSNNNTKKCFSNFCLLIVIFFKR